MISPDPAMSEQLYNDCMEFVSDPMSCLSIDGLMVRYWDEVSAAVLKCSKKYNVPPRYVIEEMCCDSDFPTELLWD